MTVSDLPLVQDSLEPADLRLAAMYKALANPTRLAIVRWLVDHPNCQCGAVVEVAGLAQSTVSGHLAVLRDAGLIRGQFDGPATCWCVDLEAIRWLEGQTTRLATHFHQAASRCCTGP